MYFFLIFPPAFLGPLAPTDGTPGGRGLHFEKHCIREYQMLCGVIFI